MKTSWAFLQGLAGVLGTLAQAGVAWGDDDLSMGDISVSYPMLVSFVNSTGQSFSVYSFLGVSMEYSYFLSRDLSVVAQYELNTTNLSLLFQGPGFYVSYVVLGGKNVSLSKQGVTYESRFPYFISLYGGVIQRSFDLGSFNENAVSVWNTGNYVSSGSVTGPAGGLSIGAAKERFTYTLRGQVSQGAVASVQSQSFLFLTGYVNVGFSL